MVTAQICYASSGSFTSNRVRLCESTVRGAYGLSSLSDNTGKSNHLQMSEPPTVGFFSFKFHAACQEHRTSMETQKYPTGAELMIMTSV